MLYNFKWSEIFLACSQHALKNDLKELQPFWTFFHNDLTLWSAATRIFRWGKKRNFVTSNANILQFIRRKFLNVFFTSSQTSVLQDPRVTCVKNSFFFKNLVLVLEMAIWECFWWEYSHGPLWDSYQYSIVVNHLYRQWIRWERWELQNQLTSK